MPRTPPPLPPIDHPVPVEYSRDSPTPPPGERHKGGPRYVTLQLLPRADYKPGGYEVTRTEKKVFNTRPYSGRIKPLWKFKGEEEARTSCEDIYAIFEKYRAKSDFVGMDVCRKFIQMGRTRSLRYALRPGGKKYEKDEDGNKVEIPRTGEVHDESKMAGAREYQEYEAMIWADKTYKRLWVKFGGKEFDFKRTIREDAEGSDEPEDASDDGSDVEGEKDNDSGADEAPPAKKRRGKQKVTKQPAENEENDPAENEPAVAPRRSKRKSAA